MRKVIKSQLSLGEVDIPNVKFDLRCRDEIPKLLMGLQFIYCDAKINGEVTEILLNMTSNPNNGRPGMDLWKILVLGTLRLNCNWDYDKLQDIANNHRTLRQMLGHGVCEKDYEYALQTLKDNVSLFTPEILDKINQIVVKTGHNIVKKNGESLKGKCDSFVVETNVHFPTDINLLFDAIRKVITLVAQLYSELNLSDWRQSVHNLKNIKKLYRRVQKLKRSNSKDEKKKKQREELILEAYQTYINVVHSFLLKTEESIKKLNHDDDFFVGVKIKEIENYIAHAERQIDQIKRRAIKGEKIPHDEKVFSIFEEHTEWISKGKAGVPQELGLRVCVVEDNYGFILHHNVMEKQTDDKIAVSIIQETRERFSEFNMCSFDKGFYTPENKKGLSEILNKTILPKKGRLSQIDKKEEYSEEFKAGKRKHSAIESAINALEQHGLDRCPDHGITGFKRYVSLSVLSRNLQILGNILQQKAIKSQKRLEKIALTARKAKLYRIAA